MHSKKLKYRKNKHLCSWKKQEYKIFNIDKQNFICCGDSWNDKSMFENSGLKVAMKNATENIKSHGIL